MYHFCSENRLTKILFSNPFPKKRSDCESQKSGFGFDSKNPPRVLCGFYGFMIRFWICPPKTQNPCLDSEIRIWLFPKTPHPNSTGCLDAPAVLPTRHCDDFIDPLLTHNGSVKITTQQAKTSKVIKVRCTLLKILASKCSWFLVISVLKGITYQLR